MTPTTPVFVACSRCGSPNPSDSSTDPRLLICHACEGLTRGPSGPQSRRLLSRADGATCPFFCEAFQHATCRCPHLPAEREGLSNSPSALSGALGLAGIFTVFFVAAFSLVHLIF